MDLYEGDLGLNKEGELENVALGLRKLHRLREEHIKLTPRTRMTVKVAAQVLFFFVVVFANGNKILKG